MKTCGLIIIIMLLGIPGMTQAIADSKWKATLLIPHSVDVNFTFKKDTLYMGIWQLNPAGK